VNQNNPLISDLPCASVFNLIQENVIQLDSEGHFIYVNNYFLNLLHYAEEDIIGHFILDIVHPDDISVLETKIPRLFQGEPVSEMVGRYRTKAGDYIWVSGNMAPVVNPAGEVGSIFGIVRDISKQKELEQQLRETQKRFHAITNQNFMGINITQDGLTRYQNDATTQITGYSIEDRARWGKDENLAMIHPLERERVIEQFKLDQNDPDSEAMKSASYRIITKSGNVKCVDDYSKRITYNGEEAWLTMLLDTTEKHHLHEDYLKHQKIESIGILAGGIAHDFNNLLTSILGNISLAKLEIGNNSLPQLSEIIEETEKAALRAAQLTKQLLTFSKGGAPVKESTAIIPLVQDTVNFVLRGSNLQPHFEISPEIPMVYADPGQMSQVIQNIVLNSKQAMSSGGRLIIRIAGVQGNKWKTKVGVDPGRKYVEITVVDEGPGISSEDQTKIFDPYFTTKKSGSGLGLSISYSIVKKHSGLMWVESKLGHGTSMFVLIPAVNGESTPLHG